MKLSNEHISAMFDVNMTELRSTLESLIPEKYRIPGSSITLSFQDSLTGQPLCCQLDISDDTIQVSLNVSWNGSPSKEKSGAEPIS